MIVLLAVLAASVVAFVLFPVFSSESHRREPPGESLGREAQALTEHKARLLEVIKDLEFERDAGKISGSEFDESKEDYLEQIARVLDRLDTLSPRTAQTAAGEAPSSKSKRSEEATIADTESNPGECPACRNSVPPGAKFCPECGDSLASSDSCTECGGELQQTARFCIHCGAKRAPASSGVRS